jgi:hypothetical protein
MSWNACLLPYLPYFSACRGFDSHIPLFLLLENEINCNLVNYNETAYVVDQWDFVNAPSALQVESAMDSCSWSIQCMYEEQISKVNNFQFIEGCEAIILVAMMYFFVRSQASNAGLS